MKSEMEMKEAADKLNAYIKEKLPNFAVMAIISNYDGKVANIGNFPDKEAMKEGKQGIDIIESRINMHIILGVCQGKIEKEVMEALSEVHDNPEKILEQILKFMQHKCVSLEEQKS